MKVVKPAAGAAQPSAVNHIMVTISTQHLEFKIVTQEQKHFLIAAHAQITLTIAAFVLACNTEVIVTVYPAWHTAINVQDQQLTSAQKFLADTTKTLQALSNASLVARCAHLTVTLDALPATLITIEMTPSRYVPDVTRLAVRVQAPRSMSALLALAIVTALSMELPYPCTCN